MIQIRFYACTISRAILWSRLETTTNRSSVRPSVPSISAVVILPHAPPDPFGPAPAANDSVPPVREAIGFRAGTQEETEAAFRRPRRAAPEDRPRTILRVRQEPVASREPRERRYNPTPLSKPSSQFITQFIAQQVLPHDEREGVGFAGDGARAYATARARAEDTLGPVIPVEIRA